MEQKEHKEIDVRGTSFSLYTYTRNLELCARMNYETEVLDFIDRIEPGAVMYDLGACEGRFGIYAAKKNVRVHAFEPDKYNFKVLRENQELNQLGPELHLHNVALGSHRHQGKMMVGQPWEGGHQKVVVEEGTGRADLAFEVAEYEEIEIWGLDQFLAENKAPFPDYLKVDIDGSEKAFMEGAKQTLADPRMKSIMIELQVDDESFEEIVGGLNEAGLHEVGRQQVPNEAGLFNIEYRRNL